MLKLTLFKSSKILGIHLTPWQIIKTEMKYIDSWDIFPYDILCFELKIDRTIMYEIV
jgi:hypothetical protein